MNGKPIALLLSICVLAGCKDRQESAQQELKDSLLRSKPPVAMV